MLILGWDTALIDSSLAYINMIATRILRYSARDICYKSLAGCVERILQHIRALFSALRVRLWPTQLANAASR